MSYKLDRLGNHIEILPGYAYKSSEFVDSGIPVIKIKNVTPPTVSLDDLSYVTEAVAQSTSKFVLKYDDVLVAMTGSHINQMASVVGRVARVKYHEKSVLNQRVGKITAFDDCDLDYIYYYLSQNEVKVSLASRAGGAANQANISPTDIKNLMVPFPEKRIQRHIAKVLRAYDDLIENNLRQIKLLEEAAQRLYKEWFVDLRFPGYEGVEVVDGVPNGWEKHKVTELTSVLRRGISPAYNDEGKYTVINQKCIRSSIMSLDEARRQEKDYPDEINLHDADTIICSTGTGTLGRVGQVYGDYPNTTIDSHVTLVRAKCYGNLLYHSVKANQEYLMGMGRGSTNQQELYRNVIEEMVVLWPPHEIASTFEEIACSIHRKITLLDRIITESVEARDRLLSKLMSGEIEV